MSANSNKNYLLICVDPGKQGAIVLSEIKKDGEVEILKTHSFDHCKDFFDVACLISNFCTIAHREALKRSLCVVTAIERPFPNPLNSRLSISSQFALYGSSLLALQQQFAQKIIELCPRVWISSICTKEERELKKEGRFLACERIYGPEVKNYFSIKNKKKIKLHDGIADAILMCDYIAKISEENKKNG